MPPRKAGGSSTTTCSCPTAISGGLSGKRSTLLHPLLIRREVTEGAAFGGTRRSDFPRRALLPLFLPGLAGRRSYGLPRIILGGRSLCLHALHHLVIGFLDCSIFLLLFIGSARWLL